MILYGQELPFTEPRSEMLDPAVQVDGSLAVLTFKLANYGKPSGSTEESILARWNEPKCTAQ